MEVLRVMDIAAPEGGESMENVRLDAQIPTTSAAPPKVQPAMPEVDALLQWQPTSARGPKGTAAWILRAAELGFLDTNQATAALQDFQASRPVHTREAHAGNEAAQRKAHPGRYDHVTRNPAGGYDVDLQDSPVLEMIVAVATKRIAAWRNAGGTGPRPKVLHLGDFVRTDFWFMKRDSPHLHGIGMDLYPQGKAIAPSDAIDLLRDLPPGRLEVFLDSPNALHIDRRGPHTFGLGIPANYIASEFVMGGAPAYRNGNQERAEREAGDDHGKTLKATAISTADGQFFRATASWDGTGWKWTNWQPSGGDIVAYILDAGLRNAIAEYKGRS